MTAYKGIEHQARAVQKVAERAREIVELADAWFHTESDRPDDEFVHRMLAQSVNLYRDQATLRHITKMCVKLNQTPARSADRSGADCPPGQSAEGPRPPSSSEGGRSPPIVVNVREK